MFISGSGGSSERAMKTRITRNRIIVVLFFVALAIISVFLLRRTSLGKVAVWQQQVSPGRLSAGHAFLETNCTACHTPIKGVEAANCVVCHANNEALLARQPSAFHSSIQSCSECHLEHQGVNRRPTWMDHAALARIGLRELNADQADGEKRQKRDQLVKWIRQHDASESARAAHPEVTATEMTLDCASCHSNKDPHFKLFGQDCAECHGTTKWTIAGFVHPSSRSTDCAQCHQAPPSHYMMHFEMVDKRIAAQDNTKGNACCEGVQVNQCYRCHQTDSWNNIKGFGWYKHH
jgi:hypothetical protein